MESTYRLFLEALGTYLKSEKVSFIRIWICEYQQMRFFKGAGDNRVYHGTANAFVLFNLSCAKAFFT